MVMTKKNLLAVMVIMTASLLFFHTVQASQTAEPLPALSLTVPENEGFRKYLGLTGAAGDAFDIADIKADIVLIELFSMYCPYCQAEAPMINQLNDLALLMQEKGVRVRIVGLGASNTQFEVEYFRDTYDVQFPLFPDKNLQMYKDLKGEGTPGFVGCRLKEGEKPQIVLRQSGGFESPDSFLEQLLKSAGY